jgi:predicted RNase H-like nuclease (RuvC/YqgF family)
LTQATRENNEYKNIIANLNSKIDDLTRNSSIEIKKANKEIKIMASETEKLKKEIADQSQLKSDNEKLKAQLEYVEFVC